METTPKLTKHGVRNEQELLARYPNVVLGTARVETEGTHKGKCTVEAKLDCGCTKRLATSDLWQVRRCRECRKAEHKAGVAERAAQRKADLLAKAEAKAVAEAQTVRAQAEATGALVSAVAVDKELAAEKTAKRDKKAA